MEKRVGTSAGLLALLAIIFHTANPPTAERGSRASGAAQNSTGSTRKSAISRKPKQDGNTQEKRPLRGPWLATQQYFYRTSDLDPSACIKRLIAPHENPESRGSCEDEALNTLFAFGPNFPRQNVTGVIATIQDPFHTRMSLAADRTLDSIQQAAYASGWEFATQWLPWSVKTDTDSDEQSTGQSSNYDPWQDKCPDSLYFARNPDLMYRSTISSSFLLWGKHQLQASMVSNSTSPVTAFEHFNGDRRSPFLGRTFPARSHR